MRATIHQSFRENWSGLTVLYWANELTEFVTLYIESLLLRIILCEGKTRRQITFFRIKAHICNKIRSKHACLMEFCELLLNHSRLLGKDKRTVVLSYQNLSQWLTFLIRTFNELKIEFDLWIGAYWLWLLILSSISEYMKKKEGKDFSGY